MEVEVSVAFCFKSLKKGSVHGARTESRLHLDNELLQPEVPLPLSHVFSSDVIEENVCTCT